MYVQTQFAEHLDHCNKKIQTKLLSFLRGGDWTEIARSWDGLQTTSQLVTQMGPHKKEVLKTWSELEVCGCVPKFEIILTTNIITKPLKYLPSIVVFISQLLAYNIRIGFFNLTFNLKVCAYFYKPFITNFKAI